MKTLTSEQYAIAKIKIAEYDAAIQEYCSTNKTNGIPSEIIKTFPNANEVDNDLRSAIEVFEFNTDKPENYFLYISNHDLFATHTTATTWTGQHLGFVRLGKIWTSNFGDKRQAITVKGCNGLTYHGTYYKGAGNYARIKKSKVA